VDYARQAFSPPLPVVYDEVFVGLYRLGIQTASQCLGVQPDVACYAKILTGGMLPMAVTLASQDIFEAFLGEQKQDALLHGHSYTAQPIGCAVSNKSLELLLKNEATNIDWQQSKASWNTDTPVQTDYPFFSLWSLNFINVASALPNVDNAMTMGTVLKITLKDEKNAGYQSTAAVELLRQLKEAANDKKAIHARPLGNTLYWMTSVNTPSDRVRSVEATILEALRAALNF
jgi:dethiobiotin synthetase/adenosylmethionine--8-amino-7-oxononanoate aminotransferase